VTAEIALLNKEAVAIAADSAVTIRTPGGLKVLPSANKIFALSKFHPVGVMIYGNSQLMEVPWELLIKSYRTHIGRKSFRRLEDYAHDFVRYLSESRTFFPSDAQEVAVRNIATSVFMGVAQALASQVEAYIKTAGEIDEDGGRSLAEQVINNFHGVLEQSEMGVGLDEVFYTEILDRYQDVISERRDQMVGLLPLDDELKEQLLEIAAYAICRAKPVPGESESGVVIVGYGDEDVYPSLRSFKLRFVVADRLVFASDSERDHDVAVEGAGVVPFAQSEMVQTFMEGVDPEYQALLEGELSGVLNRIAEMAVEQSGLQDEEKEQQRVTFLALNKQLVQDFHDKLKSHRTDQFVDPILEVTEMLPKDELAATAESLVNLTVYRRKMSMGTETVGGPVDVAVISKGDGFIWIKRKHYFKQEFNPQFFANYYRED
jgi:hypothetical protein